MSLSKHINNAWVILLAVSLLLLTACSNMATSAHVVRQPEHYVQINRPGHSLYVDKIANQSVLKHTTDTGKTTIFYSYRVGFVDSLGANANDKKYDLARGKYFDYDMEKDWTAIVKGDSLAPVFFQPVTGLGKEVMEGVIVFEAPGGNAPDTLVYKDSFGGWGTRLMVLQ